MNPIIRRILFFTFVVLFVLSGFAVLFYAQGYRYHFAKHKIEKTGQITIETRPKGATVLLDGSSPRSFFERLNSSQGGVTPLRIQHLLSGQYTIRLEKGGYQSWNKKVTVTPGKSLLFTDVHLVLNPNPESILPLTGIQKILATNSGKFAYLANHQVGLYDARLNEKISLLSSPENIDVLSASPSQKELLIGSAKDHWWVVDEKGQARKYSLSPYFFEKMRWASDADVLYASDKSGVYRIEPSKLPRLLYSGRVKDFFVQNTVLSVLPYDQPEVLKIASAEKQSSSTPRTLPGSGERILDHNNGKLLISAAKNQLFYTVPGVRRPLVISGATSGEWLDEKSLIAWDEFELSLYHLNGEQAEKELITRQSVPIKKIISIPWLPGILILSQDGSLTLYETRDGDPRNRYSLMSERVTDVHQTKDSRQLIISAVGKQEEGLFMMRLTE